MEYPSIMTIDEVAKYLQVSKPQVYKYMGQEVDPLPYVKLSVSITRFIKSSVDAWIGRRVENELRDLREDAVRADHEDDMRTRH